MDATLPAIKFPVLLAPEHNEPGEAEASVDMGGGCLQLSLVHNRSWRQLIYLEYVGLALQPLQLLLEQNTAARLVRLCASLLEELADRGNKWSQVISIDGNGRDEPMFGRPPVS